MLNTNQGEKLTRKYIRIHRSAIVVGSAALQKIHLRRCSKQNYQPEREQGEKGRGGIEISIHTAT